jgi:lipoprotein-anchoring transpeptidase ErfK/SrfK
MKMKILSRRSFLQTSLKGLTLLAIIPILKNKKNEPTLSPKFMLVGNKNGVSIYKDPNDKSIIMYQRAYNDIINIYYDLTSEHGPQYNPLWYRVWGGYVHSANLVEVKYKYNPIVNSVNPEGQLGELTVPFINTVQYSRYSGWEEKNYYYYKSVHWIVDVVEGPDSKQWYKTKDELTNAELFVPANSMRLITKEEIEPITPDVPHGSKVIKVSLYFQKLEAFENGQLVYSTNISSGLPGNLTKTPTGTYHIMTKMPSKHMGDGRITNDMYAYELMGVPWNCFFQMEDGIATHGTYWHNNFGSPMSKGCINLTIEDAKWIYRWTTPIANANNWEKHGFGTRIDIE